MYKSKPEESTELIEQWFLVPAQHDDRLLGRQVRDVARLMEEEKKGFTS